MKKILIIEDDPAISAGLCDVLESEHFEVSAISDGEKGFKLAQNEIFDLILLDLMLPHKNGIDICRDLRKEGIPVPIIMLTSKNEEVDKILGLEFGADDYVTKPFSINELLARIKAVMRRSEGLTIETDEINFDGVKINFKKLLAFKNECEIKLSPTEFKVLKYFYMHEGEVISRNKLLDDVWGYDNYPTTRTIDNFILSIRKKIEENPASPKHFLTVHSAGYKFCR